MRPILFFLIFLVLPTATYALNDTLLSCTGLMDSLCGGINQYFKYAGWDDERKKEVLLRMFSKGGIEPQHDFVKSWNSRQAFIFDFEGMPEKRSKDTIKGAWIKVLGFMPSFIDGKLIARETGQVQVGYNYSIEPPKDYTRFGSGQLRCRSEGLSKNPYPFGAGDCRTEHLNIKEKTEYTLDVNGEEVVNEVSDSPTRTANRFDYYDADDELGCDASLTITNTFDSKHWRWENQYKGGSKNCCKCRRCCWSCGEECRRCGKNCRRCGCADPEYECESSGTAPNTISLTVTDSLDAEVYEAPSTSHDIKIINSDTTPKGTIESDAEDYKVSMGEALIWKQSSKWGLTYAFPPYNILTVTKNSTEDVYVEDAYVTSTDDGIKFETYPYNIKGCSFEEIGPFGSKTKNCNLETETSKKVSVEVDDSHYELDDKIEVNVEADAESAQIVYGNKSQRVALSNGRGSIELEPIEGYHNIRAEVGEIKSDAVGVYASDKTIFSYFELALVLSIAAGLGYLVKKSMVMFA